MNTRHLNEIENGVMTVSEAARFLGIGRKLVYELIEWGELAATREKGVIRIDGRSVEALRRNGIRP